MAQLVKNPPALRETWVHSLGWEDPLENGMATHTIEIFSLKALEARSPILSCGQGHALSEGSQMKSLLYLIVSFWCHQKFLVSLGLQMHHSSLLLLFPGVLLVCLHLYVSPPLFKRTSTIWLKGPLYSSVNSH